ncbi:MAG: STN domain-containing protein [Planctomycetota bacterium]
MRTSVVVAVLLVTVGTSACVTGGREKSATGNTPPATESLPVDELRAKLQEIVSLSFSKADFVETLVSIRDAYELPIVVDPAANVSVPVTLSVKKIPMVQALNRLMRLEGLDYRLRDGVICVGDIKGGEAAKEMECIKRNRSPEWEKEIRARLQEKIAFSFDGDDFSTVLDFIREMKNLVIEMDPKAKAMYPIKLSALNISVEMALDWLMRLEELDYRFQDGVICVGDFKDGEVARAEKLRNKNRPPDGWEWEKEIHKNLNRKIAFDFEDEPFDSVIDFFRDNKILNIVMHPAAESKGGNQPITLSGRNMTVDDALRSALKIVGLTYELTSGVVYVYDPDRRAGTSGGK